MTVGAILELPFRERPPHQLLGFADGRDHVDLDYAGFGWARVDRLWLATPAGGPAAPLDDALVLALHSVLPADADAAAGAASATVADDVELEFDLPDRPVVVWLSAFLARWLPRLPTAAATVLALCNPRRARLRSPRPLHYGLGAVDAWLDTDDDGDHLRLVADRWCRTEAP